MGKQLRQGYTTGSCAAAATVGALTYLLGEKVQPTIDLKTPKGKVVTIPLCDFRKGEDWASCAAKKDSGDDPDVTDGALIYSKVHLRYGVKQRIAVDGGKGVGRVTKPGLACKVGEAAINPVPMDMIRTEAARIMEDFSYDSSVEIEISVPEGEALARRTFNSRLGILGGISILGTTGIVEPMSEKALVDTIKVEMDILAASEEKDLVITPGNYGERFITSNMGIPPDKIIKCSNFIGDALDYAVEKRFRTILLVGHVGKLIKVAEGVMNTHSKYGDRRMEIIEGYAKSVGGEEGICSKLVQCVTTEDALTLLKEEDLWNKVLQRALADIHHHCQRRVGEKAKVGIVMYSNTYGYLGETEFTGGILEKWRMR